MLFLINSYFIYRILDISALNHYEMPNESRLRSVVKAITWRVIATLTTFILAYSVFQNTGCDNVLEKSTLVAGLELIIKLVIYYFHERIWLMVPLGTQPAKVIQDPIARRKKIAVPEAEE